MTRKIAVKKESALEVENREIGQAIFMCRSIDIETSTSKMLDVVPSPIVLTVDDEAEALFASANNARTSKPSPATSTGTNVSLLGSNYDKKGNVNDTFLLDVVFCLAVRLAKQHKQVLTTQLIALIAQQVKFDCRSKTKLQADNFVSKASTEISRHIIANSKRNNSTLFNKVTIKQGVIVLHQDVTKLICSDSRYLDY